MEALRNLKAPENVAEKPTALSAQEEPLKHGAQETREDLVEDR